MLFFTHCALNRLETQPSIEDKFGQLITALEKAIIFMSFLVKVWRNCLDSLHNRKTVNEQVLLDSKITVHLSLSLDKSDAAPEFAAGETFIRHRLPTQLKSNRIFFFFFPLCSRLSLLQLKPADQRRQRRKPKFGVKLRLFQLTLRQVANSNKALFQGHLLWHTSRTKMNSLKS